MTRSAVLPDPAQIRDVIGHITPTTRVIPVVAMADALRQMLHVQLDAALDGATEMPDGSQGAVLDDLLVRQMAGYGVAIGLQCRHPSEDGRVTEELTAPVSPILGPHG